MFTNQGCGSVPKPGGSQIPWLVSAEQKHCPLIAGFSPAGKSWRHPEGPSTTRGPAAPSRMGLCHRGQLHAVLRCLAGTKLGISPECTGMPRAGISYQTGFQCPSLRSPKAEAQFPTAAAGLMPTALSPTEISRGKYSPTRGRGANSPSDQRCRCAKSLPSVPSRQTPPNTPRSTKPSTRRAAAGRSQPRGKSQPDPSTHKPPSFRC